ncbi:MAG: beta galactosidase jelly roll domain-containing protein [Anaerolineae bacterium]|nr:beta galactosidase jelly roll domain-containing protein [Anaerolineae bacterium]
MKDGKTTLDLSQGWSILQDVHDRGEEMEIYRSGWNPHAIGPAFSEWEPVDRLVHLQLLLSEQPYLGRQLRYFNEHPWYYRLQFRVPPEYRGNKAVLQFTGADYWAKVWLNGEFLGQHEGYFAPFEFEVGPLLRTDGENLLVVKVWSPWDKDVVPGLAKSRFWAVVRDMVKGTYEHADTFIQRDVNPVGLLGPVSLTFYPGVRFSQHPVIVTTLADDGQSATVRIACPLHGDASLRAITLHCAIREEDTNREVAAMEKEVTLPLGEEDGAEMSLSIRDPRLWNTWDRGEPALYRAVIGLRSAGALVQQIEERFGIRSVELRRSEEETTFFLNGKRLFVRGTAYFPDVYVSNLYKARYERDLAAIRRAGCNTVRVHVHVESPVFYDLCDELGLAVLQDSDLNWVHPLDEAWKDRAVQVVGDMVRLLQNHPSIIGWVCINEPRGGSKGELLTRSPGPQLEAEAQRLDPTRPTIRGSGVPDDLASGDSHNYTGSLKGGNARYTDIYGTTEKLNTEFGFDAPPSAENLRRVPAAYQRLRPIVADIEALQYYQYRLLKYYVEHYRITKYRPCSGYFQFMFIDLCPQSFYGVCDWWGVPKEGLKALEESNQPVGIFMEHREEPVAIWAVNDLDHAFPRSVVSWRVVDESGTLVAEGESRVDLSADAAVRVSDLTFAVQPEKQYRVSLFLRDASGSLLAQNVYRDPFHHPPRPQGHPERMSHELGMRLYSA